MTSTTDPRALVERAKDIAVGQDNYASRNFAHVSMGPTLRELADALTDALDENDRLREALEDVEREYDPSEDGVNANTMYSIAIAALKGSGQ